MSPAEQQLLSRIFASRHFAFADSLRRILQYLCDHAAGPDARPLKEHEIAVSALGRHESFDPKTDPVVRVSMASIRDRLRAYFETEGRSERLSLQIPKGKYLAVFGERDVTPAPEPPAPARLERPALRRFWRAYTVSPSPSVLMYTEPLFWRDDEAGLYTRNLYLNDRKARSAELGKKVPHRPGAKLQPCYHYLSSGEIQCSFSLIRMFQEMGMVLDMRNARLSSLADFRHASLILLGCTRTNHFMDTMQGTRGFVITDSTIENTEPRAGEQKTYRGERYLDGKLPRFTEYALVTRRPGLAPGSAVTIVASNHGRAVQGAGNLLTLETEVAALLAKMGLGPEEAVPEHFQALFRVEMIDLDDEVVNVQYVAHRIA